MHWILLIQFLNVLIVKLSANAAVISLFLVIRQVAPDTMIGGGGLMDFGPLDELHSAVYSNGLSDRSESEFVTPNNLKIDFLILLESFTLAFTFLGTSI